jgi:hypothetical protein
MPQITTPPLPPVCKTPASAFGGLNIDAAFKTKHGCEEAAWKSVVNGGHSFTGGTISTDIINGVNTTFTEDVPNIKAIFSTMPPCDKPGNNPVTSSGRYAIKTVNNKVYDVRKIRWHFKKSNVATVSGADLAHYLGLFDVVPTNTNKQTAFILLDAENAGILDQLKNGAVNNHGTIYYLMLPEYMADSATKKRWKATNELCCGKKQKPDGGVRIRFAGKIKSEYPAWSQNNRNTFFSRFSCSMEVTDFTKQIVRQDWYSSDNPTPTGPTTAPANLVQTISNSCKENNQGNVQNYLKALPSVTPLTSNKAYQQQLALQRKRSGDQMQALAIKRLGLNPTTPPTPSGSEYLHVSSDKGGNAPTNTDTGTLFNNIRRHTWLITHDLTLCSYALFLGINVLHTSNTGTTKGNNLAKTITSFRLISPPGDNFN